MATHPIRNKDGARIIDMPIHVHPKIQFCERHDRFHVRVCIGRGAYHIRLVNTTLLWYDCRMDWTWEVTSAYIAWGSSDESGNYCDLAWPWAGDIFILPFGAANLACPPNWILA